MRLLVFALALSVGALPAQKEPKRPKLPAGADTNDARAYIDFGNAYETPWNKAHDAYYWAWRMEPNHTIYLYSFYRSLWFKQSSEWRNEYRLNAGYVVKSKEARLMDSLYTEVLIRDPFPHYTTQCTVDGALIRELRSQPLILGWYYADSGCEPQAADTWGEALTKEPGLLGLRLDRAHVLFAARRYQEAVDEIQIVLDSLRKRDDKGLLRVYQSKEMLEYMAGTALAAQRKYAAAREAYGRALTENLAFFMAHHRLAGVALREGKPDEAVAEYDLAVQLKGTDGVLRYDYGTALLEAKKYPEAEVQLRRAVELEPHWAYARHNLALALDSQGKHPDALAEYKAFLDRAPRRFGPQVLDPIRERVKAIESARQ